MSSTSTPPATSSVVSCAPSVTIPVLNLRNSIKPHVKYHGILRGITAKLIEEIPDLLYLRLSPELSNLVCNTVESIINNCNNYHIDKKTTCNRCFR